MDIDQGDYESGVLIDQLSADLNLIIDKDCLLAYPISGEGFCSMWAGCRANYGVNFSKVAFEINVSAYCFKKYSISFIIYFKIVRGLL